jgi:hypothetical protein
VDREGIVTERLMVRIEGREKAEELPVSSDHTAQEELTRFLNRQGPYAQVWIKLGDGEYVRYDLIESIRILGE